MTAMVDTCVISYLAMAEPDAKDEDEHLRWMAARLAVAKLDPVVISAASYYELHACTNAAGKSFAELIAGVVSLDVRDLDMQVMDRAGKILRDSRSKIQACPRCRAWNGEVACAACGRIGAPNHKVTDPVIAAHAHCLPEVDRLLSFDRGMIRLGAFVRSSLRIAEPDHPHGELWADARKKRKPR